MPWTRQGWRTDAGAKCPGAPGQPADIHDTWGCRRCNLVTHEDPDDAEEG